MSHLGICCLRHIATSVLIFVTVSNATKGDDWPQWRGPNRDGISTDKGLLKAWPESGPEIAWQVDTVGVGYSSIAVQGDRVFTLGDLNGVEHIICLNAENGQTLWARQPTPVETQLKQRIAEELKRLDQNQDSLVDELEALQGLGWRFNNFDISSIDSMSTVKEIIEARINTLTSATDKNDDQQLTWDEIGSLFREHFSRMDTINTDVDAEALAKQRAGQLFSAQDTDQDGHVSLEEAHDSFLQRIFRRADERDPDTNQGDDQLTREEIEKDLLKHEKGKDGILTVAELAQYYTANHSTGDGILTVSELRSFFGGYRNGMGNGPRGTPAVEGERLYVEGGNGDVTCLDTSTGDTLWYTNLRETLSGGLPGWGYSESPLVEGSLLIVTPGGKDGTVVALNKMTGAVVWQSGSVTESAHYASPIVAEICGDRQIVQFARESVFGLSLEDGSVLWKYANAANGTANCATPIIDQNHVFASSAYGTGGGLAKITRDGDQFTATEVYFEKRMANHHGGIVKVGEFMYGFGNGGLICMHFLTGKIEWKARSVGKGSLCVADGMLYLLGENHEVALAEVDPKKYREKGRFKIQPQGRPSWAHPALAGGRFYIRDQGTLTAYDVRDNGLAAAD